ncbi:hypothetical protein [Nitrosomonas sp.]|uniref:hypothetical protein n=1 Tax=Nitrosomonas sp. TaxID=42353 RepID=UPI0035AF1C32
MQRSAIVRRMFHRMVHCATLNDTLPVYASSTAAESTSYHHYPAGNSMFTIGDA